MSISLLFIICAIYTVAICAYYASSVFFFSYRGNLDFNLTMELKNPWNESKPVKISRDGQVRHTGCHGDGKHNMVDLHVDVCTCRCTCSST